MSNDIKKKIDMSLDFYRAHTQNAENETREYKKNYFESMGEDCRNEILYLVDDLMQERYKWVSIDKDNYEDELSEGDHYYIHDNKSIYLASYGGGEFHCEQLSLSCWELEEPIFVMFHEFPSPPNNSDSYIGNS